MPERCCKLRGRHRKEIGDRIVVEPQPQRIGQYELADPVRAQSRSSARSSRGNGRRHAPTPGAGIEQIVVEPPHPV